MENKRKREQALVSRMIALYCKGRHKGPGLCPDCAQLARYAAERAARCPRMQTKTFCASCPTPCYRPDMRARIRAVMRYAGPRMLFRHPVLVIRHAIDARRSKP